MHQILNRGIETQVEELQFVWNERRSPIIHRQWREAMEDIFTKGYKT